MERKIGSTRSHYNASSHRIRLPWVWARAPRTLNTMFGFLVMEQAYSCKCHCHTVFVSGSYDQLVALRATGLSDISHS